MEEANNLVLSSIFSKDYRIYVSCELVEIDGIIYDELIDCKAIIDHGFGTDNRY